ncbi:hypothetical protein BDW74DRAFT_183386 [Aspergillus multicolor]|uniref:uncharacterized protein n=1 Tax=Aspergillus multicolor TaxID=41759 RepID=UPI003CCCE45E
MDSKDAEINRHPTDHNQATHLPRTLYFTLKPVQRLKGHEDFDEWLYYVKVHLESLGLKDLLDRSLPRPKEIWNTYKIWCECSIKVRIWLADSISWDVAQLMEANSEPAIFADDYLAKLDMVVFWFAYQNPQMVYDDAVRVKRKNYPNLLEFVKALRSKFALAKKVGTMLPHESMQILLREVRDDMPAYVAKALVSVNSSPYQLKDENVSMVFQDVIAYARARAMA